MVVQMEKLASRDELNKVVAAYARPTRIVRGKQIDSSWQVMLFTCQQNKFFQY